MTQKTIALVQQFDVRKSRKGDSFASLTLNLGKKGSFNALNAKIWQFDRYIQAKRPLPKIGALLDITYRAEEYRGMPQWNIEDYRIIEGEEREAEIKNFVPPTEIDKDFFIAKLEELFDEIDDEKVSAMILREVFDRGDFRESFYRAPAAMSHHQHYPGGLLEHTLNVTLVALSIASAYDANKGTGLSINGQRLHLDRTLLIAAGLMHDIGKIDTYQMTPLSDITDGHRFEGHLAISYGIVRALAEPYRKNPPYEGAADEIDKLLNCVLSHHGHLEFGSPVLPACVEAFILSQADLTDARIASFVFEGNRVRRQNPEARWLSHYHFPSGIFIGDWPQPK